VRAKKNVLEVPFRYSMMWTDVQKGWRQLIVQYENACSWSGLKVYNAGQRGNPFCHPRRSGAEGYQRFLKKTEKGAV